MRRFAIPTGNSSLEKDARANLTVLQKRYPDSWQDIWATKVKQVYDRMPPIKRVFTATFRAEIIQLEVATTINFRETLDNPSIGQDVLVRLRQEQ